MRDFLLITVLVIVLPFVAYFVAKFAAYGYLRGVERYRTDFEQRMFEKRKEL